MLRISLCKTAAQMEKELSALSIQSQLYKPSSEIISGGTVNILLEDQPQRINSALWAYQDFVLEEILENKYRLKCAILADNIIFNNIRLGKKGEVVGIKGYCIDYGGDNYIAYPYFNRNEGVENIEFCSLKNILDYLRNSNDRA